MTQFSDLPVEIIRQILKDFRPTHPDNTFPEYTEDTRPNYRDLVHPNHNDDILALQYARVHIQWADILFGDFARKYDFLDKEFVRESWDYLTMPETTFLTLMGRPYAQNLPSKRASLDYCMVWINDFKSGREQLRGRTNNWTRSSEPAPSLNQLICQPKDGLLGRFFRWLSMR